MVYKKMRFIALILSVFSVTFAFAQGEGGDKGGPKLPPDQRADKVISRMDEKLKLNADQKTKLKEVYTASFTRQDGYRQEAKGDREKFKSLSMDNLKSTESQVSTILTKDQQAQWAKMKDEAKEKRREKN